MLAAAHAYLTNIMNGALPVADCVSGASATAVAASTTTATSTTVTTGSNVTVLVAVVTSISIINTTNSTATFNTAAGTTTTRTTFSISQQLAPTHATINSSRTLQTLDGYFIAQLQHSMKMGRFNVQKLVKQSNAMCCIIPQQCYS